MNSKDKKPGFIIIRFMLLWKFLRDFTANFQIVLIFAVACFSVFLIASDKQLKEITKLTNQLIELQDKKTKLLERQTYLTSQIASQSDYRFIELTLMKHLGLVPEKHFKIYFDDSKKS